MKLNIIFHRWELMLLLSFAFLISNTYAQQSQIQKLENELPKAEQKQKVEILYRLAKLTYSTKPAKCISYSKDGIKLSSDNNIRKASFYHLLAKTYRDSGDKNKTIRSLNNELKALEKSTTKPHLMIAYYNAGLISNQVGKNKQAADYYEKSLALAINLKSKNVASRCRRALYKTYTDLKDYQNAMKYYAQYIADLETINLNRISWLKIENDEIEEELNKVDSVLTIVETKNDELLQDSISAAIKIKDLQLETELKEQKVEKQRDQVIMLILLTSIITIFAIILYRQFLQKKRAYSILDKQKQQIEIQAASLTIANTELERKNKQISDSIEYAKNIQQSLLIPIEEIKQQLPESFIFFQPRDIVSGDFYWFHKQDNKTIIVAADCTGHGIPGALLTMIGCTLLKEIVVMRQITQPAQILTQLHREIFIALRHDLETSSEDGIDLAMCLVDSNQHQIHFAGAKNPLYIVDIDTNEPTGIGIKTIKADFHSLGEKPLRKGRDVSFTSNTITYTDTAQFFMTSDGYLDQFDHSDQTKFGYIRFKELLVSCFDQPAEKQKELFTQTMKNWMGNHKQMDDILIVGFKPSVV